jgi:hypothetical protein
MFSLMWLCVHYIRKWFYPNLSYIGGGEIAYWLELKSFLIQLLFNTFSSELRALKHWKVKKANKLELSWNDLFSKQADLVNAKTMSVFQSTSTLKKISYKTIQYEGCSKWQSGWSWRK